MASCASRGVVPLRAARGLGWPGARIGPALHGTRVQAWTFATWGGTLVDLYAWLELQVRVAPRASLLVSAQGGFQLPVVSLGLRWDLDLAGSLATGAIRPEVTLPSGR
ncbi:MAG: hypothetical protein IPH72_32590 [Sandaracinaceae bacterium]|nr:hypothetical protein [Sandaracinaceae bacterium]